MTISVLQENGNLIASTTTVGVTLTLSAGSSLHVLAAYYGAAVPTLSVADGVNTYSSALDVLTSSTISGAQFTADGVAAGSTTITLTSTQNASGYLALWVREIGGTSGSDAGKHNSLLTASSVTSTNGTTGTSVTPSVAPGLLSSFAWQMTSGQNFGSNFFANGTAFTVGNLAVFPNPNGLAGSESSIYAAIAAQQALWTASVAADTVGVWTALFKQTGAGGGGGPSPLLLGQALT
jgi:hypothetical protein